MTYASFPHIFESISIAYAQDGEVHVKGLSVVRRARASYLTCNLVTSLVHRLFCKQNECVD